MIFWKIQEFHNRWFLQHAKRRCVVQLTQPFLWPQQMLICCGILLRDWVASFRLKFPHWALQIQSHLCLLQ